ncbi:MAG: hypothetical protein LBP39_03215 [Rickettsiales bacterium]|jgi:hypothetical protein|nr:hypothetical protein [Rickettsiales bacterium]
MYREIQQPPVSMELFCKDQEVAELYEDEVDSEEERESELFLFEESRPIFRSVLEVKIANAVLHMKTKAGTKEKINDILASIQNGQDVLEKYGINPSGSLSAFDELFADAVKSMTKIINMDYEYLKSSFIINSEVFPTKESFSTTKPHCLDLCRQIIQEIINIKIESSFSLARKK